MTKIKIQVREKITGRCQNRIFDFNYNPTFFLWKCACICIAIIDPHIKVKFKCFIIN